MTTRTRLLLAALTATLTMAFAVGTAAALRSLSINRNPLSVSSPELTFTSGETRLICPVTINASLSSTIPKREGVLMGHIERLTIPSERCRNSQGLGTTITILNQGTWRLFFKSFLGTLPRITGILSTIEQLEFLINIGGLALCLYRGAIPVLAALNATGEIESLSPLPRNTIPLFRDLGGLVECPRTGEINGTFTPSTRPRITLL